MTCNRCEWFWSGADTAVVSDWLRDYFQLSATQWHEAYYSYHQQHALRHLMTVASGLDSMVIGESQILGQMKAAIQKATDDQCSGKILQQVFAAVFAAAKRVRTQTGIGSKPASVAYAAVSLTKCIFNDVTSLTVLLVGAGDTIDTVMKHFQKLGVSRFIVANRTLENAVALAQTCQGLAVNLQELTTYLPQADVVVTATTSPEMIIFKHDISHAIRLRKRPMHLIDLAVPRDIDAAVGSIDGVYLYNVDDLQKVVEQNKQDRLDFFATAQHIIEEELATFLKRQQIRHIDPVICAYRSKMENIRDIELEKAKRLLENGVNSEEVLLRLANDLTNKFMHEPTTALRSVTQHQSNDVMSFLRRLFNLEPV
jgi:glutamyl-tRNA reductase